MCCSHLRFTRAAAVVLNPQSANLFSIRRWPVSSLIFAFLLFALSGTSLVAQSATEVQATHGRAPIYDPARETTVVGTVQEVITKHTAGGPAGMLLVVAGPNGVVNAHLGPFVNAETKAALRVGEVVEIVGVTTHVREKEFFLVRELTVAGHTVEIRSAHGFLIFPHTNQPHGEPSNSDHGTKNERAVKAESNGDVR